MAGEHLAAVLGGRQTGRVHRVRARVRPPDPGSAVLRERGARKHALAGGSGTPWTERWNSMVADTVCALLEHGAFYDIFTACGLNDLERVRGTGGEDASALMQRSEAEMTPLHWAARAGSAGCVKWLLRNGAEVDAETLTKRTPLHLAAERGQTEPIRLLAEHGASLNVQDKKGRAPLPCCLRRPSGGGGSAHRAGCEHAAGIKER